MAVLYDIHQHLFNKTIIDREIVSLALLLSNFINVDDGDDRKVYQILGSVDDFLNKIGSDDSDAIFLKCQEPYLKHFPNDQIVYTPLTFDLTYADDDDLDGTSTDQWVIKKRKQSLRLLNVIGTLVKLVAPVSTNVQWKKIGQTLKNLTDAINNSQDIIRNQNFDEQIEEIEALVDKYGTDKIKPFYSIDPRKARRATNPVDFIEVLTDKILNGKFFGVKLYTTTGFSPTDPVLYNDGGVYDFCRQHNIPVTVHNSDGGFGTFALKVKVTGDVYYPEFNIIKYHDNEEVILKHDVISVNAGKAIFERANRFNHPLLWKKVLDKHKDLRLNLAHFGGSGSLMELVHYEIPDEFKKMTPMQFSGWISKIPHDLRSELRKHYLKPKNKNIGYRLKESFEPEEFDSEVISKEKDSKREKYWEQLFDFGMINNFSRYQLEMIESDQYPNLYVDLSAFSEGDVYNFQVPFTLREISAAKFKKLRKKISDPEQRNFFESKYSIKNPNVKDHLITYDIDDEIEYSEELKLTLLFRDLGILDKDIHAKLDLIKDLLSFIHTDNDLINYLADNRNYSILEELNAFKTKLYDNLEERHKEKILYGSDFYFTQVFGPRHEQYVEDFKNVFGIEFHDIANKHCRSFLGLN